MGFCSQFKALFKKNFIVWRRNLLCSLCELLFPVILGLILVLVRNLVDNETIVAKSYIGECSYGHYFDENINLQNTGTGNWMGLCPGSPFSVCLRLGRTILGVVADDATYAQLQTGFLNNLGGSFSFIVSNVFWCNKLSALLK